METLQGDSGTMESLSSEEGVIRSRCLGVIPDITLPAQDPLNGGDIPVEIQLDLFDDVQLTAVMDGWVYNPTDNISWLGTTTEDVPGSVIITVVRGKTSATIRQGMSVYLVRPDPECDHVVVEVDATVEVDDGQDTIVQSVGALPPGTLTTDDLFIDILLVYSEAARLEQGGDSADPTDDAGIVGWANNQVHEMDKILQRSDARTHIPRLVHIAPSTLPIDPGAGSWDSSMCCDGTCDSGDTGTGCCAGGTSPVCPYYDTLGALKNDTGIAALRDQYYADLVGALLSESYEAAGVANSPDPVMPVPGTTTRGFFVSGVGGYQC